MAVESGTLSVRTTSKTVDSAPASAPMESDMAPETPAAVQAGKWRENLTALFSVIEAVLLKPLNLPDPDRVMQLMLFSPAWAKGKNENIASSSQFNIYRERREV